MGVTGRAWSLRSKAVVMALVAGLAASTTAGIAEAERVEGSPKAHPAAAVRGDKDADPRDLAPLKSQPAQEERPSTPVYGTFDDAPTPDGKPPKGWRPDATGFVEGESEVIDSLTTSTQKVYENPDGTKTAELTTTPVRFKDASGEWTDFDPELVERDGALVPTAAPPSMEIAADPEADVLVQTSTSAGPVGLVQDDAAPTEVEAGETSVTFENVDGGADLDVALTPTGFETTLVVPSHEVGAGTFTQTLVVPAGVSARQGTVGVELVDKAGKVVGTYGSGVAWDASDESAGQPVSTTLAGQKGDQVQVQVGVPSAWFDSPDRTFPVSIDPTFTTWTVSTGGMDTYVQSNSSTPQSAAVTMYVGAQASNTAIKRRTFLKFDLSSIQGYNRTVQSADLELWNSNSGSCTAKQMNVRNLTSAFNTSTVWSNQPSWGSNTVSATFAKGYSASCPAGVQTIDVQPIVNDWMFNSTNYGFGLIAANESDGLADKSITSAESWVAPKLTVTYNRPPSTIGTQAAPADGEFVGSTTPTLQYNAGTDPDGDPLSYWFVLSTQPDIADGQIAASGWLTPAQLSGGGWKVPDGVLVDGQTYYWTLYTYDGMSWPAAPPAVDKFTVDLRLGSGEWPTDAFGPGEVNLTTGNFVLRHDSRSFATVAGDLGVSFEYNSQATNEQYGLNANYYYLYANPPTHRPGSGQTPQLSRRDQAVSFDWGNRSPGSSVPADGFYAKWTGNITIPTSGNYKFGGTCSDGMLIKINGSTAFDRWSAGCSSTDTDPWSGLIALTGGQTYPIEVEFWDEAGPANINLKVRGPGLPTGVGIDLPSAWLSPGAANRLPKGWTTSLEMAGVSQYRSAEISNDSVNLIDTAGASHQYGWDVAKQAWQPPQGEQGVLTALPDGSYSLVENGTTYVFSGGGRLLSVKTASEMGATSSPAASYNSDGRLESLTDPVSSRALTFHYSGSSTCTSASGFTAAPAGMLCAVSYGAFSAGTLQLRYNSSGQLVRFDEPGSEVTDYAYDGSGRISRVRDPLAADAVAAGVRSDNDTTRTVIAYDASNRVSSITEPEPLASETRPAHTYTYTPGSKTTDVTAAGLTSTSGRLRRVTYDGQGRQLTETDLAGRVTNYGYNADGNMVTTWESATGLKSTIVYDAMGNATDKWGPAPTSWWSSASAEGAPTSNASSTPHTTSAFDEGLSSLAASWYNTTDLTGLPVASSTGVGHGSGAISVNWGSGSPAGVNADFSGLLTGWVNIPDTAARDIRLTFSGQADVTIGDQMVADGWASTTGTAEGTYQGPAGWTPIAIQYANPSGSASLTLDWRTTGGSYALVPGTNLRPGYGLETSTTDPDGKQSQNSYSDSSAGLTPADGILTATTIDPSGLALTTATGSESSGLHRRTSRTLPLGTASTVSTEYYSNSDTATIPCSGGASGVPQAGLPKIVRSADPSGSGTSGIAREVVYDSQGRPAATRVVVSDGSGWTCTTYDDRGRTTSITTAAQTDRVSRTTSFNYAVSGNPLQISATDTVNTGTARTVFTTVDLAGQTRSTTDAWNKTTTTTIDAVGRLTSATSPVGTQTFTYDADGNAGPTVLDGTTLATPHWDSAGRLSYVEYANGTKSDAATYDNLGRQTGLTWRKSSDNSVITSEAATYSLGERMTDLVTDGFDPRSSNPNYIYDGAGRLTEAWSTARNTDGSTAAHHAQYGFGTASGSCGSGTQAQAGKNTNRTSMTVGDGGSAVTTTYCYDAADRLVSTSQSGVGTPTYDNHGNTTAIWGETRSYDVTDRHLETIKGTTTVSYQRDAADRIIGRSVKVGGSTTDVERYGYIDATDVPAFVMNSSGTVIERSISLPGGATATFRGSTQIWTVPNLAGSASFTTNGSGTVTRAASYDPYGIATGNAALPDNSDGSFDYGWQARDRRPTEAQSTLAPTIEMGARQYDTTLGRFLSVDPIEGGCANDYAYVHGDPTNFSDPSGMVNCGWRTLTRSATSWGRWSGKTWLGAWGVGLYGHTRYGNFWGRRSHTWYVFWNPRPNGTFRNYRVYQEVWTYTATTLQIQFAWSSGPISIHKTQTVQTTYRNNRRLSHISFNTTYFNCGYA